jgi:hypothetical protein
MTNSIKEVTSIAAAAAEILEGHDTTVMLARKALTAFDDRVIDISANIKDVEKTIAALGSVVKKTRITYQRVENAHHSIMNAAEAEKTDDIELSKSELHDYVDNLNELVDVDINSLRALKSSFVDQINALIGVAEAATKMEKAVLRVL